MKQYYNVILLFENGKTDVARASSNTLPNLESRLQNINWLKCEETKMIFNMNKVLHFHIEEVNS